MSAFDSLDQSPPPVVTELYSVKRHGATITIATPSQYRPQVAFRLTRFWASGSLTWLFSRSARIPVRFSDVRPRMSAGSAGLTACAASHDVKEPLRGIYQHARQLVSESR